MSNVTTFFVCLVLFSSTVFSTKLSKKTLKKMFGTSIDKPNRWF